MASFFLPQKKNFNSNPLYQNLLKDSDILRDAVLVLVQWEPSQMIFMFHKLWLTRDVKHEHLLVNH